MKSGLGQPQLGTSGRLLGGVPASRGTGLVQRAGLAWGLGAGRRRGASRVARQSSGGAENTQAFDCPLPGFGHFFLTIVNACRARRTSTTSSSPRTPGRSTAPTLLRPGPTTPRPAPAARVTGTALAGSQRLIRVVRQKVAWPCSRAKRAMLNFFWSCQSCASPKAPETPGN